MQQTTSRDAMIRQYYNTLPTGRNPFHPRKQTGPTASFLGVMNQIQHERHNENQACSDSHNDRSADPDGAVGC